MGPLLLDSTPAPPGTGQYIIFAVGIVTIIYLAVVRPMRKPKKDPLARKPFQMSLAQQRVVEREMSNLLVEYEEMIRRMTAQVDTCAAKLEMLIRDADEAAERLRAMTDAVKEGIGPHAREVSSGRATDETRPPAGSGDFVNGAGPVAPSHAMRDSPTGPTGPTGPTEEIDPRHIEIYRLSDDGKSVREIAEDLERPTGEIELILALRGARK